MGSLNLQVCNLVTFEGEDEIRGDRAVGKVPGELAGNDGLALALKDVNRIDPVLELLRILEPPGLDGGKALLGPAFAPDGGIGGKAVGHGIGIVGILRGEVDLDRFGQFQRQGNFLPCFEPRREDAMMAPANADDKNAECRRASLSE